MAIKRNVLAESGATVQAEDGTTMYATIQMRHGKESDMDKSKFVPAEIGVATDTKKAFMAFGSNQVKEMMFREDSEIEELLGEVREISDKAVEAVESAETTAKQTIQDFTDQMKATIPEDYTETVKKIDILERTKAPAIYKTASGESLQIEGTADAPVAGLKVYGKGIQNGTPTPDSLVNIDIPGSDGEIEVSMTGNQLLDIRNKQNIANSNFNISFNNGVVTVNGSSDDAFDIYLIGSWSSSIVLFSYDKYTLYCKGATSDERIFLQNAYQSSFTNFAGDQKRTFENTITAVMIRLAAGKTYTNFKIYPMLNKGSTALPFEPYKETSISISTPNGLPGIPVDSNGNYTDSDGQQWICDEVDFTRGKYVQRVQKVVYDGSESWNKTGTYVERYYKALIPNGLPNQGLSNYFAYLSGGETAGKFTINNDGTSVGFAFKTVGAGTSVEDWKDWLNQKNVEGKPLTLYYCLLNPIETDLSEEELTAYAALRTNYPTTVVTSDSDPEVGIEVEYVADTQKYIDNKFAELAQNLAATQNTLLEV